MNRMRVTHAVIGRSIPRAVSAQALAFVAALITSCVAGCGPASSTPSAGPSVLVQTTQVRKGSLPQIVRAYGTVQANSSDRDSVTVTIAAMVADVYVRAGEEVRKGAPLVRLAPTPQSESAYAQALSALRVARDLVGRTRELLREHLATRQQLTSAEKVETDARAALDALRVQGASGLMTIRAPFHGIVTTISTSAHAIASAGSVLLELVRPDALVLDVGVTPSQASQIEVGDRATLEPIGGAQTLESAVEMRGAVVDATTGLVAVQLSLPTGALLPGQWARAEITVGRVNGYVVPHDAVLVDSDGGTYIVQVHHGLARIVHVRVLAALGSHDTVSGPIDGLAPLVLSGNYQLTDGMRIRLSDPAQAKATK
jgi:membrane fusion protein, multidrug efflux system